MGEEQLKGRGCVGGYNDFTFLFVGWVLYSCMSNLGVLTGLLYGYGNGDGDGAGRWFCHYVLIILIGAVPEYLACVCLGVSSYNVPTVCLLVGMAEALS